MKKNSILRGKNIKAKSIKKRKLPDRIIEYVVPIGQNGWMVKNNHASKFTLISDSKREAVSIARAIAKRKKIELIVYKRNAGGIEIHEKY